MLRLYPGIGLPALEGWWSHILRRASILSHGNLLPEVTEWSLDKRRLFSKKERRGFFCHPEAFTGTVGLTVLRLVYSNISGAHSFPIGHLTLTRTPDKAVYLVVFFAALLYNKIDQWHDNQITREVCVSTEHLLYASDSKHTLHEILKTILRCRYYSNFTDEETEVQGD